MRYVLIAVLCFLPLRSLQADTLCSEVEEPNLSGLKVYMENINAGNAGQGIPALDVQSAMDLTATFQQLVNTMLAPYADKMRRDITVHDAAVAKGLSPAQRAYKEWAK